MHLNKPNALECMTAPGINNPWYKQCVIMLNINVLFIFSRPKFCTCCSRDRQQKCVPPLPPLPPSQSSSKRVRFQPQPSEYGTISTRSCKQTFRNNRDRMFDKYRDTGSSTVPTFGETSHEQRTPIHERDLRGDLFPNPFLQQDEQLPNDLPGRGTVRRNPMHNHVQNDLFTNPENRAADFQPQNPPLATDFSNGGKVLRNPVHNHLNKERGNRPGDFQTQNLPLGADLPPGAKVRRNPLHNLFKEERGLIFTKPENRPEAFQRENQQLHTDLPNGSKVRRNPLHNLLRKNQRLGKPFGAAADSDRPLQFLDGTTSPRIGTVRRNPLHRPHYQGDGVRPRDAMYHEQSVSTEDEMETILDGSMPLGPIFSRTNHDRWKETDESMSPYEEHLQGSLAPTSATSGLDTVNSTRMKRYFEELNKRYERKTVTFDFPTMRHKFVKLYNWWNNGGMSQMGETANSNEDRQDGVSRRSEPGIIDGGAALHADMLDRDTDSHTYSIDGGATALHDTYRLPFEQASSGTDYELDVMRPSSNSEASRSARQSYQELSTSYYSDNWNLRISEIGGNPEVTTQASGKRYRTWDIGIPMTDAEESVYASPSTARDSMYACGPPSPLHPLEEVSYF